MICKWSLLLSVFSVIIIDYTITQHSSNVCKNYEDYLRPNNNENCYYNEDVHLKTPELIRKYYISKFKSYKYTSKDGYIQTIFRIPRQNSKGNILFEHPLTADSKTWVTYGKDSLASYLWNAGYEIWLNNNRGTTFSEKHETLDINDPRYWDFSFHEMGVYDISMQVQLIAKATNNSKIIFIGHSMGSTAGLIYAAMHPEEAKKSIKALILMGTPCYFKYSTSPTKNVLKAILRIGEIFPPLIKASGQSIPFRNIIISLSKILTRLFPLLLPITDIIMSATTGWTLNETDPAIINFDVFTYLQNFPWKCVLHYAQLFDVETKFQMFDYGREKNLQVYGSAIPPLYPLEKISVPVILVSSANDTLTTLQDDEVLFKQLSDEAKIYGHLKVSGLNHFNYFIGRHINEIYVNKLFNLINTILN